MEALAIEQFIRKVTVPIFSDEVSPALVGTGTLFSIADRYFVVTAAHLFEDTDNPAGLACPENPTSGELYNLEKITIARPQKANIDVAVVELLAPKAIARMQVGWQFLTLSNVRAPYDRGVFVLSGFPDALSSHAHGKVSAPLATIYSERMTQVPLEAAAPVDLTLDLFFHYDAEGVSLDNQPIRSPALNGTSGGSVWEYYSVSSAIWSAEAAVKVIGIQSAYLKSGYFRAKNWGAVAEVLKRFDDQLSNAVRAHLNY